MSDARNNQDIPVDIQRGDVVRGRRPGRKSDSNYVVLRYIGPCDLPAYENAIEVYAHREYGGSHDRLMFIENARVIRSYGRDL